MNRLSKERSAYLRHSAHHKIDWYPWSDEAFKKAAIEKKPVFLSAGAVWCHWCHVMAKESFEDEGVAQILNEKFICIKIDRDERPDIDRRYQKAVSAMGYGSGWPLSVFLTPEKKPFHGGTYFPPDDSFGHPGFRKVLHTVAEFYETNRDEVSEYTEKVMKAIRKTPVSEGGFNETDIDNALTIIMSEFDPDNGGFGRMPKFPMPGALSLLMNRCFYSKDAVLEEAIRKTLASMTSGGFYDHLGGGFHRYSVDEAWMVPHFEKMADDNAWLLRTYTDAYSQFGDNSFREIAEGTIGFIREVLMDPDGGFYTSQDADVTPDDEGGYFTWSENDFRALLSDDEFNVLSLFFLNKNGAMHHDPSKMVLSLLTSPEEIAAKTEFELDNVNTCIRQGSAKLISARNGRESPFIDRSMYTSINGMLSSSFLNAYRVFRDNSLKDDALRSIDRIIKMHYKSGKLYHVEGVDALLEDYIHIIDALILAYEVTGIASRLQLAEELFGLCMERLWDDKSSSFFDSETDLLSIRIRSIDDIPHPAANSVAIILLLKLHCITGVKKYMEYALGSLRSFTLKQGEAGLYSSYYYNALDASYNMLKLTIMAPPESDFAASAISLFHPHLCVAYKDGDGSIIPCIGNACFEAVDDIEALEKIIRIKSAN